MNRLTLHQINRIFDLMRMDSNNFSDSISKELRNQIIQKHGLSESQVNTMEQSFIEAFRNIYQKYC